ncbi:transmembrane 220 family protein [Seonamhaeicola maritimus]|uniref:transmembrane 220 family protein n=1 Tax=Seonamhaeicola maritimus TaxID=2591822 RepID=UPI00249419B9|nr:transmembrane 220 family protein [Seonamhaeicola maritimus]
MTKKTINIILGIIFILFAVMQINDPDGWLWFVIYIVVAAICLYSIFKSIPKPALWIIILALLAYCGFHFSLFMDYLQTDNKEELFGEMVYEKPYLEGTREFLGLLIAAFGVMYQLKKTKT